MATSSPSWATPETEITKIFVEWLLEKYFDRRIWLGSGSSSIKQPMEDQSTNNRSELLIF